MSQKIATEKVVSEFRGFVTDQLEPLYHFVSFLSADPKEINALVVSIFRELGANHRKHTRKNNNPWGVLEARILLFQIAWKKIKKARFDFSWDNTLNVSSPLHQSDDLLHPITGKHPLSSEYLERFLRVDPDLRCPLVLRDVLNFDEEEIVRVMELRWAAYRHRLHRARLEFKNQLRGRETGLEPPLLSQSGKAIPDMRHSLSTEA